MGLYVGISFISLMEIFDLFFLRLVPRAFGRNKHLYGVGGRY